MALPTSHDIYPGPGTCVSQLSTLRPQNLIASLVLRGTIFKLLSLLKVLISTLSTCHALFPSCPVFLWLFPWLHETSQSFSTKLFLFPFKTQCAIPWAKEPPLPGAEVEIRNSKSLHWEEATYWVQNDFKITSILCYKAIWLFHIWKILSSHLLHPP